MDESVCFITLEFTGQLQTFEIEEYGINMTIPPWKSDSMDEISVQPLTRTPHDLKIEEDEVIIAVGLKFSPSGLKFNSPVKITLPHCAVLNEPEKSTVRLYTRASGKEQRFFFF